MAVTPQMLATALGQAAPVTGSIQEQQWMLWIADAEMHIDNRVEKLEAPEPDEAKRDYVVREAVVAHIKRPDDATDVTIAVDDGSTSKRYQSGKGRVTILDEWWTLLGLVEQSGAFSFDMAPGVRASHRDWCSLAFGAGFCSCGADIAGKPLFEASPW